MKKNFKFLIALLFIGIIPIQAQTSQDLLNLKKYWWYHHRLLKDFMAKGDCQGCSEVIAERAFVDAAGVPDCSAIKARNKAKWGDQTDDLGNLIGVLATEYRLEANNSLPTDSTIEELYYVLKAFNRLDEMAEPFTLNNFIPFTMSSSTDLSNLNGFFIRDDVPDNFLIKHPKLAAGVTSQYPITEVNSGFKDDKEANSESMDHAWHILAGCALVRACLPHSGIVYRDKVTHLPLPLNDVNGETDLWKEANYISERIITHMKSGGWFIFNPFTGHLVSRGAGVLEYAFGAAEDAAYINNVNEAYTPFSSGIFLPKHRDLAIFQDVPSYLSAPLWNNYGKPTGSHDFYEALYQTGSTTDFFKPLYMAAQGNSWFDHLYPVLPDPTPVLSAIASSPIYYAFHPSALASLLATLAPVFPSNVTEAELGHLALTNNYEWLPLLRQELHGGSNPISESVYTNLLNLAPCNGPYNFGYSYGTDCSSTFEWSSHNRLRAPDNRGNLRDWYRDHYGTGPMQTLGEKTWGEYPGVDYMLYYNLNALTKGIGSGVTYNDYMDRIVTLPFPIGTSGTISNPAIIDAFNTSTASNIINNNADVTIHAGLEITLTPGFEVLAGGNFDAYVSPFHCGSDDDYRHMIINTSDTSSNSSNNDNAVAFLGNTTFVYYPKQTSESYYTNDYYPQNNNSNQTASVTKTIASSSEIVISPNPNNGSFIVSITNNKVLDLKSKLTVYDIVGTEIFSKQINTLSTTIDISGKAKGIYYVRIENEQGVKVEKIVYQ